jgi:hypothetical protein
MTDEGVQLSDDGDLEITMYITADEGAMYMSAEGVTGKRLPIFVEGEPVAVGTVVAAELIEGGKAIQLTVKLDRKAPELADLFDYRRRMN